VSAINQYLILNSRGDVMKDVRAVILAGGFGSRLSEETVLRPKPMVEINGKPILFHIMKIFSSQGIDRFTIALGYKGEVISKWLTENSTRSEKKSNLNSEEARDIYLGFQGNNWEIETLETGLNTQTGGRVKKCLDNFAEDQKIILTYGDGLANVNLKELLKFHSKHGKIATVTAVRPPSRFGALEIENGLVTSFEEKNQAKEGWINGGFIATSTRISRLIADDYETFEHGALTRTAKIGELMAFKHYDFFQPMDTLRERNELDRLAKLDTPPWFQIAKPF
jgi:glucose-1-phosphate cytidylyltransferase